MRKPVPLLILSVAALEMSAMQPAGNDVRIGAPGNRPYSAAVKAGGFIYVSGTVSIDDRGAFVGGDIKAQTRRALGRITTILHGAESDLAHVASVQVYIKHATDFAAFNEVYRTYFPKEPPARTTVEVDLPTSGALVEIALVAIPKRGERKVIHPPGWMQSPNPYSYGIKSGDTLFLAGLVSRNGKDNSVVAGDMKAQTRTVLENARAILAAAGMTYRDVVSSRVYVTDAAAFQDMNEVYRSYFASDPPARATVRAGPMNSQNVVEITMLAVAGERRAFTTPTADGSAARPNPNLSSAIAIGNRLYLSGMLGSTDANKGDAKAQTRETLVRIGRTLNGAGFDWKDVADAVVYLPDIRDYGVMNEAYREVFGGDYPARATVQAGLMNPAGRVEIMMVATK